MTNLRQAAQQALEALEGFDHFRRIMTDGPDESDKVFAEDHAEVAFVTAARVIPALRAALAEPEQQPVAKVEYLQTGGNAGIATRIVEIEHPLRERLRAGTPLYTAPTPRKPLTDDQIVDIWAGVSMGYDDEINIIELARALERAHGIGEQP